MDIYDRATETEELQREQAIQSQRAKVPRGVSALVCSNPYCGDEIPQERRLAVPGCQYCIHCQQLKERGLLK